MVDDLTAQLQYKGVSFGVFQNRFPMEGHRFALDQSEIIKDKERRLAAAKSEAQFVRDVEPPLGLSLMSW